MSGCKTVKLFFIEICNADNYFISSNFSISLKFITDCTTQVIIDKEVQIQFTIFLFQVIMKTFDNSNLVAINANQKNSLACLNKLKKKNFRRSYISAIIDCQVIDFLSMQNQIEITILPMPNNHNFEYLSVRIQDLRV